MDGGMRGEFTLQLALSKRGESVRFNKVGDDDDDTVVDADPTVTGENMRYCLDTDCNDLVKMFGSKISGDTGGQTVNGRGPLASAGG